MGECWRGQVEDGPQNARLSRPRGLDARLTDARRVCARFHIPSVFLSKRPRCIFRYDPVSTATTRDVTSLRVPEKICRQIQRKTMIKIRSQ